MQHPLLFRGRALVLALLLGTWVAGSPCLAQPSARPVVQTKAGPVVGAVDGKVVYFKGIPFATAPVGNLRWAPPSPPAPWATPLDASTFGPACPQPPTLPYLTPSVFDEDCLTLNVWVPYTDATFPPQKPLPVMLWWFGGGFYSGDSSLPLYDGAALALSQNVIVVSSNYRIGALGFLASSPDGLTGNYGLMDQLLALNWVQNNSGAFGGNPGMVTVFGESAGAMSVGIHVTSPASAPLIHRAIMESNPLSYQYRGPDRADVYSSAFKAATGCADVACLRELPLAAVANASAATIAVVHPQSLSDLFPWTPVVNTTCDIGLLCAQPYTELMRGAASPTPMLLGNNADECMFTVYAEIAPRAPITQQAYPGYIEVFFGGAAVPDIASRYPCTSADCRTSLASVISDAWQLCPTANFANSSGAQVSPVFAYRFTHDSGFDFPPLPACLGHACHTAELPYVFNSLASNMTAGEQALSQAMMGYWATFGSTLDAADLPLPGPVEWPPVASGPMPQHIVLDQPLSVTAFSDPSGNCQFWLQYWSSIS